MESKNSSIGRSHNWVFTINNPDFLETSLDDDEPSPFWDLEDKEQRPADCTYIIAQLEKGESGTKHLQGYAEFKSALRISRLKSWKCEGHYEPRIGRQWQAIDYCKKSQGHIAGPWEWGVKKAQGQRSDLHDMVNEVKKGTEVCDIIFSNPPALKYISHLHTLATYIKPKKRAIPRIAWLYGLTGAGKTHAAWECFESPYLLVSTEGSGPQWWQGYAGEKCVIIDEFSGSYPFKQLLQVLDSYPFRVSIKGSSASLRAEKFIITSNVEPENLYSRELDRTPYQRRLHEWALLGLFRRVGEEFRVDVSIPNAERGHGDRIEVGCLDVPNFIKFLKEFMNP